MYFVLVIICAIALSIGFWLDNEITPVALRFWWISIVIGYLVLCLRSPVNILKGWRRVTAATVTAGLIFCSIIAFDDLLTLYICGAVLMLLVLVSSYLSRKKFKELIGLITILISLGLIILPIAMNRIVITLPNLSAGTNLSLHDLKSKHSTLDMLFRNRGNQHSEVPINFGAQIYLQDAIKLPRLKIDILRQGIVIRMLSIRYDVRVGLVKLPLMTIREDALMQMQVTEGSPHVGTQMDRNMLLIDRLKVDEPAWFQLPPLSAFKLSFKSYASIILIRLLFWLAICGALIFWCPSYMLKHNEVNYG